MHVPLYQINVPGLILAMDDFAEHMWLDDVLEGCMKEPHGPLTCTILTMCKLACTSSNSSVKQGAVFLFLFALGFFVS